MSKATDGKCRNGGNSSLLPDVPEPAAPGAESPSELGAWSQTSAGLKAQIPGKEEEFHPAEMAL